MRPVHLLSILGCIAAVPCLAEEWLQYMGGPAHLGSQKADGPSVLESIAWETAPINACAASNPCLMNGRVYVYCAPGMFGGGDTTAVACIDNSDGTVLWYNDSIPTAQYGSWSSVVADPISNSVYIGTADSLCRFHAETGELLWGESIGSVIVNCSPLVAAGMVFIHNYGGFAPQNCYLTARDTLDGTEVWRDTCGGQGSATPAYDSSRDRLYVTIANKLRAYDAATGHTVWTSPWTSTHAFFGGGISYDVSEDVVYASTYNFGGPGELFKVDAARGDSLWRRSVPRTDACPAVRDGNVVVLGGYDVVSAECRSTTDGSLLWEIPQGDWNKSPVIGGGYCYITGSASSGLNVVDMETGDVLDSATDCTGTPMVVDSGLYVFTTAGAVRKYVPPAPPVAAYDTPGTTPAQHGVRLLPGTAEAGVRLLIDGISAHGGAVDILVSTVDGRRIPGRTVRGPAGATVVALDCLSSRSVARAVYCVSIRTGSHHSVHTVLSR